MVELSAHASNRRPALKNGVYRNPSPDGVTDTPEMSRAEVGRLFILGASKALVPIDRALSQR